MIAKITRGSNPGNIGAYLHGPGHANEHFYERNGGRYPGGVVVGGNVFVFVNPPHKPWVARRLMASRAGAGDPGRGLSRSVVFQPVAPNGVLVVGCETSGRRRRDMGKLIGYARVSTRSQGTDRQVTDLLGAGVRRDDLYVDHGVSGARTSRPGFEQAVGALQEGDTLVVTTLDRLGRSTQTMLELAQNLRGRGVGLRVLNLGGGDVDTSTPMGSMVFTVMAALAEMELEIKRERVTDSIAKRRAAGGDLGGRRQQFTDSQIRSAQRLIQAGQPAAQVARDLGMSRATLYRRIINMP